MLPQFGMKLVFDANKFFHCVDGRTAIGIEPVTRRWVPSGSTNGVSACTTFACERLRARTCIGARWCSRRWLQRLYADRKKATGHRLLLRLLLMCNSKTAIRRPRVFEENAVERLAIWQFSEHWLMRRRCRLTGGGEAKRHQSLQITVPQCVAQGLQRRAQG
jgi:hypothetical protein